MDDDLMQIALSGMPPELGGSGEDEGAEFVGGDAVLDEDLEKVVGDDPEKKDALYRAIRRCVEKHGTAEPAADESADPEGY